MNAGMRRTHVMSNPSRVALVERAVQTCLVDRDEQSLAHRCDHFARVARTALEIASELDAGVDTERLQIAAWLHDVDQPYSNKEQHVELSERRAETILTELGFDPAHIAAILRIIHEHSTEHDFVASTPESSILFDADKIDGVGHFGILRVFALCGQRGVTIQDAVPWHLRKIANALLRMNTRPGRARFVDGTQFVLTYYRDCGLLNEADPSVATIRDALLPPARQPGGG